MLFNILWNISIWVCVCVCTSVPCLQKSDITEPPDAIKSLSGWCQRCTQAHPSKHPHPPLLPPPWAPAQASACTSRHPTPADLRRGVSTHPRLCAAWRARTFSLTRVEIWLPYFTALAAFVNANSFPAPPPYPSLLQLDYPNGGFGF